MTLDTFDINTKLFYINKKRIIDAYVVNTSKIVRVIGDTESGVRSPLVKRVFIGEALVGKQSGVGLDIFINNDGSFSN
jgi:hypothetical protein